MFQTILNWPICPNLYRTFRMMDFYMKWAVIIEHVSRLVLLTSYSLEISIVYGRICAYLDLGPRYELSLLLCKYELVIWLWGTVTWIKHEKISGKYHQWWQQHAMMQSEAEWCKPSSLSTSTFSSHPMLDNLRIYIKLDTLIL